MKRHWKLTVPIVGVVVAGMGIGLALGLRGSSPSQGTAASTTTTVAAAQFTKPQQVRLEQGITAPTVTAEASILAIEVRSQFDQRGKPLLPAGSHVSILDSTFHAFSAQLATVNATVAGSSPGRWKFVLVREAGQWLLLGTRKLS